MYRLVLVLCLLGSCLTSPVNDAVPAENVQPVPTVPDKVPPLAAEEPTKVEKEQPMEQGRSFNGENEVNRPYNQVEESLLKKLNSKCAQRDASSCAMLKLVTYMNRLLKKSNINIADNVQIQKTAEEDQVKAEDLSRSFSNDPEETQLVELMMAKVINFIKSRSMRLHLLPSLDALISSSPDNEGNLNLGMTLESVKDVETGRGKNKNMGGIMAALVMKFGMLGALAFKGLILLVGKALLISKIALLLAVVIGLKKLFSQQKHVTYEVVAQPHHSHAHVEHVEHAHAGGGGGGGGGGGDSYSSGWGRSIHVAPVRKGNPHNLAYKAYAPH